MFVYVSVALAVLLDFLLQITAFVALVTLDFLRAKDNRIDCFPCIKVNSSSTEESEGTCELWHSWILWFSVSEKNHSYTYIYQLMFWV